MRVGIVDLGGNTARLLVARLGVQGLERVVEDRVVLGLGAEIERDGRISKSSLKATEAAVAGLWSRAGDAGCAEIEVLVTSPGRQIVNRGTLQRSLARAIPKHVRFVSAEEEGRLARAGAVACTRLAGDAIAVCDVGGGSTEITIGEAKEPPTWCRSLDLGSLLLTQRHFKRLPPSKRELEGARAAVHAALATLGPVPQTPSQVLASGGTARALRKLVGKTLGPAELKEALALVRRTPPEKIARWFDLPTWRAAVLPGGAVLLSEIQIYLGVPLTVAGGGLREGAALGLLARAAAA